MHEYKNWWESNYILIYSFKLKIMTHHDTYIFKIEMIVIS